VLAELNSGLGKPDERDRLFALSDCHFNTRKDRGINPTISHRLPTRTPFCSRRIATMRSGRTILDCGSLSTFYNRGIALGLATKDGKQVDLSSRQLSLPFGSLNLSVEPAGFNYGGNHLTKFVSLADLEVRGFRNTYRRLV